MNDIQLYSSKIFEDIKHTDECENEFWYARELQQVLEYKQWRYFEQAIIKAKEACLNAGNSIDYHFAYVRKMIILGKGGKRNVVDYKLSRYACYLIVMNGDSRKKVIALGQTYFAVQTRKMELLEDDYNLLTEDEKRIYQRNLTRKANKTLNNTAKDAGVKNFDKFHNAGYKGLYNGETADAIAKRKGLRYREDILDNMGSSELVANLFRIDQTNQKLINDKTKGEINACNTHYEVGHKVRETIKDLGGTMPEDLETPDKSIKELERKEKEKLQM